MTWLETQKDRENEGDFFEKLNHFFIDKDVYKAVRGSPYDFFVIDSNKKLHSIVEFKRRNYSKNAFPNLIINLEKLINLNSIKKATSADVYLFIEWNDGIVWHKLKDLNEYNFDLGGRKDRGASTDETLIVRISLSEFTDIEDQAREVWGHD